MRFTTAAYALFISMAMQSQVVLDVNKPRILHSLSTSQVFAYPSAGGLVRKHITRVELDWLSLTPPTIVSNATQRTSDDATVEDDLALRLMQIGGRWWPSIQLYERHNEGEYYYGHHYPPDLDIGYPGTGGVLVLKTWAENSPYSGDLPDAPSMKPNDWSRLGLCRTMEERCDVLRDFGAIEYGSVEECPDVPRSLVDGIAFGKEYETLLKKMEDWEYVDKYLMSL